MNPPYSLSTTVEISKVLQNCILFVVVALSTTVEISKVLQTFAPHDQQWIYNSRNFKGSSKEPFVNGNYSSTTVEISKVLQKDERQDRGRNLQQ